MVALNRITVVLSVFPTLIEVSTLKTQQQKGKLTYYFYHISNSDHKQPICVHIFLCNVSKKSVFVKNIWDCLENVGFTRYITSFMCNKSNRKNAINARKFLWCFLLSFSMWNLQMFFTNCIVYKATQSRGVLTKANATFSTAVSYLAIPLLLKAT